MTSSADSDRETSVENALLATVGPAGRMITASKTRYRKAHPTNAIILNANICLSFDGDTRSEKRWFGDIDLSLDEPLHEELAKRTGAVVYVLYERDARFATAPVPQVEDAVYSVTPTGETRLSNRIERSVGGRLRRARPGR